MPRLRVRRLLVQLSVPPPRAGGFSCAGAAGTATDIACVLPGVSREQGGATPVGMIRTSQSAKKAPTGYVILLIALAVAGSSLGAGILLRMFSSDMDLQSGKVLVPVFIGSVGLPLFLAWVPVKWSLRHGPGQLARLAVVTGVSFVVALAALIAYFAS